MIPCNPTGSSLWHFHYGKSVHETRHSTRNQKKKKKKKKETKPAPTALRLHRTVHAEKQVTFLRDVGARRPDRFDPELARLVGRRAAQSRRDSRRYGRPGITRTPVVASKVPSRPNSLGCLHAPTTSHILPKNRKPPKSKPTIVSILQAGWTTSAPPPSPSLQAPRGPPPSQPGPFLSNPTAVTNSPAPTLPAGRRSQVPAAPKRPQTGTCSFLLRSCLVFFFSATHRPASFTIPNWTVSIPLIWQLAARCRITL